MGKGKLSKGARANRVTSRDASMKRIENAGFYAHASLRNVNEEALSYIADEAERLQAKYNLGTYRGGMPTLQTEPMGGNTWGWSYTNTRSISLSDSKFTDGEIESSILEIERNLRPRSYYDGIGWWYVKPDADRRTKITQTFRHEFGHSLQSKIISNRWSPFSGRTWNQESAAIKREIMGIAKKRYGNPNTTTANLSGYARKNGREFFAEVFNGYESGYDTPVTRAMGDWLKENGYIS